MATTKTAAAATQAVETDDALILSHENDLVETNSAKLYLNVRTSDVCFIFDVDQSGGQTLERICAHKVILAAGSDVFDAMFFGLLKEKAEVKIVDASAAAFKEFLQFFYRRKMQLTIENLGEVVYLCRKYQVDDALMACEQRLEEKLNIANMCWGYVFAKNLDLAELRHFCESKIQQITPEILQSASFLDSRRDEVFEILKLLSIDNYSPRIIDAYMNWAIAECVRESLEPNAINLRARLGDDLIKMIPFNRMSMEQFAQHTKAYSGFFTANEFEMIKQEVVNRCEKRQHCGNFMDCDRRIEGSSLVTLNPNKPFVSVLVTSKSVLLTEIYANLIRLCSCVTDLVINYSIYKIGTIKGVVLRGETTLAHHMGEIHIVVPEPILISNDQRYEIVMRMIERCGHDLYSHGLENIVQMNDEIESDSDDDDDSSSSSRIEIKFENIYRKPTSNANDCVTRLKFNPLNG